MVSVHGLILTFGHMVHLTALRLFSGQTDHYWNALNRPGDTIYRGRERLQKSDSRGNKCGWEEECIVQFKAMIPASIEKIYFVADRGFGGINTQIILEKTGFFFSVRLRNNICVANSKGEIRTSAEWAPRNGSGRIIRDALITGQRHQVAAVIVKHATGMKEPWVLATSDPNATSTSAVKIYSRRFRCEEMFRDIKDPHFGMGQLNSGLKNTDRRDRILWISAVAQSILMLLGRAGEETGLDRRFRADTRKKREYILFRQGNMYYNALPTVRDERAVPLLQRFDQILNESGFLSPSLGLWK